MALRFGDSQIIITREETWDFLLVTVGASFMGTYIVPRVCWPVDVQMQKQNGGSAVTRSLQMLHLLDPGYTTPITFATRSIHS